MSANSTEQFRPEMDGDRMVSSSELLADVVLDYSARFPSAIEMFEPFPDESGLGLITEDKVALGHRRVLLEVPSLADLEVATEFPGYVRPQRDGHSGIE